MERGTFSRSRVQQEGETFDDSAKPCNFPICNDECTQTENIRDQIITGLADGEAVEDLLKEKNLTLDTALTKCCVHEAAKRQRAKLAGGTLESSIHTVRRKQRDPIAVLPEAQNAQGAAPVSTAEKAQLTVSVPPLPQNRPSCEGLQVPQTCSTPPTRTGH